MSRDTKIVATLGPASSSSEVLERMIRAGVDVVRLNFSHGTADDHIARAQMVREVAARVQRPVGILADLQGPKIRIGKFREGAVQLAVGDQFTLDAALPLDSGDQQRVGLTFKRLPNDVSRGDTLLLDDGQIVLWVNEVAGPEVRCKVVVGGKLSSNKGLNKQGGGLSAPALTDKDRDDICFAAEVEADYVAVSFVRSADDVNEARRLLREAGGKKKKLPESTK
jgi:pyruvate kinase